MPGTNAEIALVQVAATAPGTEQYCHLRRDWIEDEDRLAWEPSLVAGTMGIDSPTLPIIRTPTIKNPDLAKCCVVGMFAFKRGLRRYQSQVNSTVP